MDNKVKFQQYADILRAWSAKMNLVAPSTLSDIENRHFADSAQLADVLPPDAQIIDLGSGAGFPGVVLAILGWHVTCIESIGKKVAFLTAVKERLDLQNLTIYHGRVEDFVKKMKFLGNFCMKNLYLTITDECNLHCPHCYKEDFKKSLFSFEKIKKILPWNEFYTRTN